MEKNFVALYGLMKYDMCTTMDHISFFFRQRKPKEPKPKRPKEERLTKKQMAKVKSKAFISDDDTTSSDDDRPPKPSKELYAPRLYISSYMNNTFTSWTNEDVAF